MPFPPRKTGFPRTRFTRGSQVAPPVPQVPSAPQSLTTSVASGTVSLNWVAPASSGSSSITAYNIYEGTISGAETLLTSVSGSTLAYIDGGKTNGITYYYYVKAVNLVGLSPSSNEASGTPPATIPMQPPDPFALTTQAAINPFPNAIYSKPVPTNTPAYYPHGILPAANSATLVANFNQQASTQGYGRPYLGDGTPRYVVNTTPGTSQSQTWTMNPGNRWPPGGGAPMGTIAINTPPVSTAEPAGYICINQTDHTTMFWDWNQGSPGQTTYSIWGNTTVTYNSGNYQTDSTPVIPPSANTLQVVNADDTTYPGFGGSDLNGLSSSSTAIAWPFIATNITWADFQKGVIEHAMYCTIGNPTGFPVNPAPQSDGVSALSIGNGGVPEGTWFILPQSVANPGAAGYAALGSNAPALCAMVHTAAQKYGIIIGDSSAANGPSIQFERFENWSDYNPTLYNQMRPPTWAWNGWDSPWGGGAFIGFPFGSLIALEPGSLWPPTLTDNNGSTTTALQDAQGTLVQATTTSVALRTPTSLNDVVVVNGMVGPTGNTGNTISGLGATWVKVFEVTETYSDGQRCAFQWVGYGCSASQSTLVTNFTGPGDIVISRWSGGGANPIVASATPFVDSSTGVKASFPTNSVSSTAAGQVVLGSCHIGYFDLTENAFPAIAQLNYGGTTWASGKVNRHVMNGQNRLNTVFQNYTVAAGAGSQSASFKANGYTGWGGYVTEITVLSP